MNESGICHRENDKYPVKISRMEPGSHIEPRTIGSVCGSQRKIILLCHTTSSQVSTSSIEMIGLTCFLILSYVFGGYANETIPKPECDSSKEVSIRYAASSNRVYVESLDGTRGGRISLTQIYESLDDKSPLSPTDTDGEWFLESELFILDGITLEIHGTESGGDCDYLKLKSDSESFIHIRGHGGSIDIMDTMITSWDSTKNDVDTDLGDGRAYISAISEVPVDEDETCKGVAKNDMGESRMDIEGSEIAYMGYKASESWGISWKIRGLCSDLSNLADYEDLGVYGNILDNDIHHLYYGHYCYGHINGVFTGNKVHDNEIYGFDPHHGSRGLIIADNEVYNNGNHGIIFSKRCTDVLVENNHVYNNEGVGIFPHYLSDRATITGNRIENNEGSGIAFLESNDGVVTDNFVSGNRHGIRFSVGSRDNVVLYNEFEDNTGYDVYTYRGSDPVVELPDGNPTNNIFFSNEFSGNPQGFRFDNSVNSQFVQNKVEDSETFELNNTDGLLVLSNEFPETLEFDVSNSCLDEEDGESCGEDIVEFTEEGAERVLENIGQEPLEDVASDTIVFTPSVTPTVVSSVAPTVVSSVAPSVAPTKSSVAPTISPTPGSRGIVFSSSMETGVPTSSPSVFFDGSMSLSPTSSPTSSPIMEVPGAPIDDVAPVDGIPESSATDVVPVAWVSSIAFVLGFVVLLF